LSATGFAFFVNGFLAAGTVLAKSFFNCLAAALASFFFLFFAFLSAFAAR